MGRNVTFELNFSLAVIFLLCGMAAGYDR